MKHLKRFMIVTLLGAGLAAGTTTVAQQAPSVEHIVDSLAPKQFITRSWRGIQVEDAEAPDPEEQNIDLTVTFEFGSAELTLDATNVLRNLGLALQDDRLGHYVFELAGHTDAVGGNDANLLLSQKRANAAKVFLENNCRIDGQRLKPIGYGETQPLLASDPEADANRRVQIRDLGRVAVVKPDTKRG